MDWYDSGAQGHAQSGPEGSWSMLSRMELPLPLSHILDGLRHYLAHGTPMGTLPWDSIDLRGLSDFQIAVYKAATIIPHGETRTYAWIARRIGNPSATRAVGQALRKNPFPIIIPCHRVTAANTIGGFMGIVDPDQPEMKLKNRLIEIEHNYLNPVFSFIAPSWHTVQLEATG